MRSSTKTRSAILTALGLAGALALTGCSGGGPNLDGTYFTETANNSGDLGHLVIKDGQLTHHEYKCEGIYEEPDVTSTGEFTEDRNSIVWTVAGDDMRNERVGTEPITVSDTSITISSDVYLREDSDAGKALLEKFQSQCSS